MIRFIDIESGDVFNGSKPYIFWMDKEQSVNLIYVKKICVMSDSDITVSIPDNLVFKLLDMSRLDELTDVNINEFKYKNIQQLYTNSLVDEGITYQGHRIHMIYIAAQSDNVGEVHEDFTINNEDFEIAADFYPENESLRINLANFGVEIPESIQTAIYDENVHEESKDNILLNRKYKELLLNYWNIVAGRGSYQSLIDSLNWFEYGDLVKIEEIWRHDEWGQTRLNREELNTIMTEEVRSTLSNFTKTTYLGIYAALQKYVEEDGEVQYEKLDNFELTLSPEQSEVLLRNLTSNDYEGLLGEMVPKLENKFFKWSVQEMSLKMYLLGSFYEAYFMPIHLDLMHSTIESLVFTNTIKCLNVTHLDRIDHIYNTETFECNIRDNSTYQLQDVNIQAGSMLKRHWDDSDDSDDHETSMSNSIVDDSSSDDYDSYPVFGVEDEYNHPMQLDGESSDDEVVNNRLKSFMINNYNGQGVVLPFECIIPAETGDFINSEKIIISVYRNDQLFDTQVLTKHFLYRETQGKYAVNFNLLLNQEGKTIITLYFTTAGGRSYIKVLHLDIVGDAVCKLKMYKVKSSDVLTGLNTDDYVENFKSVVTSYPLELQSHVRPFNDYMFTHTRDNALGGYRTFIPCSTRDEKDTGAKLNHVLIFDANFFNNADQSNIDKILYYVGNDEGQLDMFDIGKKEVRDENEQVVKTYYILVSKPFVGFAGEYKGTDSIINDMREALSGYILRYSKGFFFQHHYLEEIGIGYNPETEHYEYGLSLDNYTITDKDTLCVVPDMKYSNIKLDETEWIFRNVSTKDKEEYRFESIEEPFVGNNIKKQLKPGFYDVIFRYRIDQTDNEVKLNSAFRKV